MKKELIFKKLAALLKERGAVKVAVFGSYIKEKEHSGSDIDVVVEFSDRKSLLDLVKIQREVSESLGIKIDLLTEKSNQRYLSK